MFGGASGCGFELKPEDLEAFASDPIGVAAAVTRNSRENFIAWMDFMESGATICTGITKKGTQCRACAGLVSGYRDPRGFRPGIDDRCYQHIDASK